LFYVNARLYKRDAEWEAGKGGERRKKLMLMPLFPVCYHFANNVIGKVLFKSFSSPVRIPLSRTRRRAQHCPRCHKPLF